MKLRVVCIVAGVLVAAMACAGQSGEWVKMFDGATLDGWKAAERPDAWSVRDGAITGDGGVSHLFWMKEECVNCEFKAMVKINNDGNSGMYFRAQFGPGWPKGYEAQVNSTHGDWRRTGSLYMLSDVKEQLVPPDTWFEQHIIANGNHIVIKVNGKTVVDHVDEKNTHTRGYLALQQHHKGSLVQYKDLMFRRLPEKK
jgi:hypothetical protein